MTIRIPKEIEVGGYAFEVRCDEETTQHLIAAGHDGEHSYARKILRFRNDLPQQEITNLFLHEILHAIDGQYCASELEEKDILRLANGLHQVLKQLGISFELD